MMQGLGCFSISQVTRIVIGEVKRQISEATPPQTAIFALYDEAAYRAFEAEL